MSAFLLLTFLSFYVLCFSISFHIVLFIVKTLFCRKHVLHRYAFKTSNNCLTFSSPVFAFAKLWPNESPGTAFDGAIEEHLGWTDLSANKDVNEQSTMSPFAARKNRKQQCWIMLIKPKRNNSTKTPLFHQVKNDKWTILFVNESIMLCCKSQKQSMMHALKSRNPLSQCFFSKQFLSWRKNWF